MSDTESEGESTAGLHGLTEALKGQTVLEKPRVKRRVLVQALREHNDILIDLQNQVSVAKAKIDNLEYETSNTKKALGALTGVVEEHSEHIADLSSKMDGFAELVDEKVLALKTEVYDNFVTKVGLAEALKPFEEENERTRARFERNDKEADGVRARVATLEVNLEKLPGELRLGSHQIIVPPEENSINHEIELTEVIKNLHQHNEETNAELKAHKKLLRSHTEDIRVAKQELGDSIRETSDRLTIVEAWKKEQEEVDIADVRRNQEGIMGGIEALQRDLIEKIDRSDVDEKIEAKYEEIIDHLQTALQSTQEDEDEFRRMTSNLQTTVENLQNHKAEKKDLAEIRRQLVVMEGGGGFGGGGGGPGGVSRRELLMLLDEKMDKQKMKLELSAINERIAEFVDKITLMGNTIQSIEQNGVKMAAAGGGPRRAPAQAAGFLPAQDQIWSGLATALRNSGQPGGDAGGVPEGTPLVNLPTATAMPGSRGGTGGQRIGSGGGGRLQPLSPGGRPISTQAYQHGYANEGSGMGITPPLQTPPPHANAAAFYPSHAMSGSPGSLRPVTAPGVGMQNQMLANEAPITNANKYGLNPRNAYGGGFQLNAHMLPPRVGASPFPHGPGSPGSRRGGAPLRPGSKGGLPELADVPVPLGGKKRLVKGTDGHLYQGDVKEDSEGSEDGEPEEGPASADP
uniref:Uncharacterized protein n=1 Tax=Phaeomonas parva TaxID=124430 RepID=A0A7S1XT03_9STRA|mmetsp:Transcript_36509/g.114433  ORF Transcript_36509/g.114433 Transcript_36509/m.114433 type:complete len:687 (+) Transcript_36509:229-2289(+)|eukprot:CAMPEP_0118865712 /NCGR_PEP_ID=MMETSP1163-20130328/9880_1 /TAXON_ID=124430 /ORGANISM="Phaeomonas parva, Strain CCMP2877" /LENGTH=686 /DNA_ID=CAMNT_0006799961 /DNA_START=189 /DNA_END=2249 /DNA_ORIENTATION=+